MAEAMKYLGPMAVSTREILELGRFCAGNSVMFHYWGTAGSHTFAVSAAGLDRIDQSKLPLAFQFPWRDTVAQADQVEVEAEGTPLTGYTAGILETVPVEDFVVVDEELIVSGGEFPEFPGEVDLEAANLTVADTILVEEVPEAEGIEVDEAGSEEA